MDFRLPFALYVCRYMTFYFALSFKMVPNMFIYDGIWGRWNTFLDDPTHHVYNSVQDLPMFDAV